MAPLEAQEECDKKKQNEVSHKCRSVAVVVQTLLQMNFIITFRLLEQLIEGTKLM